MNTKIAYPMAIAALLAFGTTTLSPAFAQDAEKPAAEEQQKPEGGEKASD